MTACFAFIDFETHALVDPLPIEVAWVVTGPALLNYHQVRHRFIWPDISRRLLWESADPFAVKMHEASGLRCEWNEWATRHIQVSSSAYCNVAEVDAAITADIEASKATLGADTVHLAGNGIGPFDVPIVRRFFPLLTAAVHYRPLDISSVREMGRLVGLETPWEHDTPAHRAVEDVESSIRSARWWRTVMGTAPRLAGTT